MITAIAGTIAYTMTNQLPQDEKQFSEKERKVLLQTFQTVTSEKKQPLRRVIDSQNPLNLVNYYGDEPLLTLWNSIPENQQPYTVLLLIPGNWNALLLLIFPIDILHGIWNLTFFAFVGGRF